MPNPANFFSAVNAYLHSNQFNTHKINMVNESKAINKISKKNFNDLFEQYSRLAVGRVLGFNFKSATDYLSSTINELSDSQEDQKIIARLIVDFITNKDLDAQDCGFRKFLLGKIGVLKSFSLKLEGIEPAPSANRLLP